MDRKALGATVVAIALCSAGCGGSKPLTHAEFVKQANAVCKQIQAEGQAAFRHARANHGATLRVDLRRAADRATAKLKAIKAPDNVRATFARYISAFSEEVAAVTSTASQTRAGSLRQERATHLATRLKEDLGLSSC